MAKNKPKATEGQHAAGGSAGLQFVSFASGKDEQFESYSLSDGPLEASVSIVKKGSEHQRTYFLSSPRPDEGTAAFMEDIKAQLLKKISISTQEVLNIKMAEQLKSKFFQAGNAMVRDGMPHLSEKAAASLSQKIVQDMLGLGEMEFLLKDDLIEEICINGSGKPIWLYHKKYGWLKSNIVPETEAQIWNYASSISRGVGRQINAQSPLLDAYLSTGDRVNATLFPISYFGNTMTIRKFARKPWTITDYMKLGTLSPEVAALLWLAVQYELNVIVSGGTGAGKTSLLNVLTMFFPPSNRVVSIEQTREINLPQFMQWAPLVVRQPSSEGTGGVGMLDLMVNSLRMRPDRMIVGEIRTSEEAQVLFEAMHTGHSVYATLHAETVSETVRRMVSPPISIAPVMMESLHLIVAMYRDRRSGLRRMYELGEIIPTDREGVEENIIYRWRPLGDEIVKAERSVRLLEALRAYTNMGDEEIKADLEEKEAILRWLLKKDINTVEAVGEVVSAYYDDPAPVLRAAGSK